MAKIKEVSSVMLPNGGMLEQIKNYDSGEVFFAHYGSHGVDEVNQLEVGDVTYKPIANVIVETDTVLFPSSVEDYGSIEGLRQEVQGFIHRYVDISDYFERIASYYVLLSWVYDRFNVLPYLRVIGEPGTGKSRFLHTMAAVSYKPMRTSGAISIASIFRMIAQFHGTLILEEADLSNKSDEYAAAVKILNCGHEKGNPVIRQEATRTGYESVAYDTYCPKVISTRKRFDDTALETRMITEKMTRMTRRENIPLNLPAAFYAESLHLRNKLLMFRFKNYHQIQPSEVFAMKGIEPRILHILSPFLDMMPQSESEDLLNWARQYTQDLIIERGASVQGDVVRALFEVIDGGDEPTVKAVADKLNGQFERDADKLSNRRVGKILNDLTLIKRRNSRGAYAIDVQASSKTLDLLARQYGIDRD